MCREGLPSLYTWSPIPKVTPPSILTCTLRSPLVVSPHAYTSYCVLYAPLVPECCALHGAITLLHLRSLHTMSMFSSLSRAVQASLDTVGKVAIATQEVVTMGTTMIDHKSIVLRETGKNSAIMDIARESLLIKRELDADADLKALFEASEALFK